MVHSPNTSDTEINERLVREPASPEMPVRPPITLALFAYKQEDFVRDAIAGAFAQTYSPLTIILSDDHSPDQTFPIMEEMAHQYTGPHKIVLNRNETNLGLCGHLNRVMELVDTEWVVVAAGDDISLPFRVEATWKAIQANPDAYSIFFDLDYIRDDENNYTEFVPSPYPHTTENFIKHGWVKVAGPSHAWKMSGFNTFGPIPSNVTSEDSVIPFRSTLLGKVVYVREKAVKYRLHFSSISTMGRRLQDPKQFKSDRLRVIGWRTPVFDCYLRDLQMAKHLGIISAEDCDKHVKALSKQKRKLEIYMRAWQGPYFSRIASAALTLLHPTSFTGENHKQRLLLLIDAVFPFLDGLYHKHVRCRRL